MISDFPLKADAESVTLSTKQRTLLLMVRQALIMVLGALEDYLELERSIIPKHKRVNA